MDAERDDDNAGRDDDDTGRDPTLHTLGARPSELYTQPVHGLTEIVGDPGAGKTSLAVHLHRTLKTLYITSKISHPRWFPAGFIIQRIDTFLKLKAYVLNDLEPLVKKEKIEKIILDGLDEYFYVIEAPRRLSNEVFQIIRILRHLSLVGGVVVFIVNGTRTKWPVCGVHISNSYFGLPWEYLISRRYVVGRTAGQRWVKNEEGKERVFRLYGREDEGHKFYIDDRGVHFII